MHRIWACSLFAVLILSSACTGDTTTVNAATDTHAAEGPGPTAIATTAPIAVDAAPTSAPPPAVATAAVEPEPAEAAAPAITDAGEPTAVTAPAVPPTPMPPTPVPPTAVPPTSVPPTPVPATPVPATPVPATPVPATPVPAGATISLTDVSVINLNSGQNQPLAELSPQGPALLWFWAPH